MSGFPKKPQTILVVDDDPLVVSLVISILEAGGFVVLPAASGFDALKLATDYAGNIDLLLADVKMPGMSGPDLAEFLRKARPGMHLMFMSGFTVGDYLTGIDYQWLCIQKPFGAASLLKVINDVLNPPDQSQVAGCYARRDEERFPSDGTLSLDFHRGFTLKRPTTELQDDAV